MDITFEFATRDDCLDRMVPSDLRALVAERDQLKARVAELSESLSTTSDALHNASLFILAYDETLGDDYGASACEAWTVLKRKEAGL